MLKNEKQYNSANLQLQKWLKALEVHAKRVAEKQEPDWLLEEEKFGIDQQIQQLQSELREYEDTAAGKKQLPSPTIVVAQLPALLVSCRIARHWTQKDLAERVGMHENQIQKYESEDYACASLQTISKIAVALQNDESHEMQRPACE
ncbi:MAG TPA: helix-turn-helix transcriptional regulator [Chroococcales cyanobacterium]